MVAIFGYRLANTTTELCQATPKGRRNPSILPGRTRGRCEKGDPATMPLDGTSIYGSSPIMARKARAAGPVARLIRALRSPLPPGFEWDFRDGGTCALGLAVQMGLPLFEVVGSSFTPFSANEKDGIAPLYGVPARDVTPAMVADALEQLMSSAGDR